MSDDSREDYESGPFCTHWAGEECMEECPCDGFQEQTLEGGTLGTDLHRLPTDMGSIPPGSSLGPLPRLPLDPITVRAMIPARP